MATKEIPREYLFVLNQIFDIERKLLNINENNTIQRNIERLKNYFESEFLPDGSGLTYHNPQGEKYTETRTDCEASIAGDEVDNLIITEVIKPIIRYRQNEVSKIVQKGVVIVESEKHV